MKLSDLAEIVNSKLKLHGDTNIIVKVDGKAELFYIDSVESDFQINGSCCVMNVMVVID